jgi:ribonuclease HII
MKRPVKTTIDLQTGFLAGVDEAGRGPLAGPVVSAAVILNPNRPIRGLADSKVLSRSRREALCEEIKRNALGWAIGRAEVQEIDRWNILQASLIAMSRAVAGLAPRPVVVWVDGNTAPVLDVPVRTIVRGDARIPAISAASIVAKVTRDAEMTRLESEFPGYGFARHKGYPTKYHLEALHTLGVCEAHRRSFGPVRKILALASSYGI